MDTLTKTKYSLIEGTFNAEDAKDILLGLVEDKIRFHQHRIFSHEERFGKPCEDSVTRISQLQKTRKQILELTNHCQSENKTLRIHSDILIEFQ
ncbi:MAG: hypothetical protein H6551_03260 [Chitinophagales bacterium]|nr:hypothetical protein [Chitinophagaceae bacterium]MCB9064143.1 hypothetical protein [Chitinophagales bacterium]